MPQPLTVCVAPIFLVTLHVGTNTSGVGIPPARNPTFPPETYPARMVNSNTMPTAPCRFPWFLFFFSVAALGGCLGLQSAVDGYLLQHLTSTIIVFHDNPIFAVRLFIPIVGIAAGFLITRLPYFSLQMGLFLTAWLYGSDADRPDAYWNWMVLLILWAVARPCHDLLAKSRPAALQMPYFVLCLFIGQALALANGLFLEHVLKVPRGVNYLLCVPLGLATAAAILAGKLVVPVSYRHE